MSTWLTFDNGKCRKPKVQARFKDLPSLVNAIIRSYCRTFMKLNPITLYRHVLDPKLFCSLQRPQLYPCQNDLCRDSYLQTKDTAYRDTLLDTYVVEHINPEKMPPSHSQLSTSCHSKPGLSTTHIRTYLGKTHTWQNEFRNAQLFRPLLDSRRPFLSRRESLQLQKQQRARAKGPCSARTGALSLLGCGV